MSPALRDSLLVLGGMAMGLGLHEVAHMGWAQFQGWRRRRDNWFRPQKPSEARPGPGPAQHPTPRTIKGQRPAEGRHRPKQTQARFGARVRRRVVPQPARVSGPPTHLVDESAGGDPTY